MPTTDALLEALTIRATSDELRPVAHFIGECVARRQTSTLARFHTRARQLRRLAEPSSWHRGFADSIAAFLDGYFAEVEPTLQRENLAREVVDNTLWSSILHVLCSGNSLNQGVIRERITRLHAGGATSKSAISIALEDLRVRELVEYVPGKTDRRERFHSLTVRGRELLQEPILASALQDLSNVDRVGAPDQAGSSSHRADGPDAQRDKRQRKAQGQSASKDANGAAPGDDDVLRKRKPPSEPPAAGS